MDPLVRQNIIKVNSNLILIEFNWIISFTVKNSRKSIVKNKRNLNGIFLLDLIQRYS